MAIAACCMKCPRNYVIGYDLSGKAAVGRNTVRWMKRLDGAIHIAWSAPQRTKSVKQQIKRADKVSAGWRRRRRRISETEASQALQRPKPEVMEGCPSCCASAGKNAA